MTAHSRELQEMLAWLALTFVGLGLGVLVFLALDLLITFFWVLPFCR